MVRYRIVVPEAKERIVRPLVTEAEDNLTYPLVVNCHCNDCRRHTSSLYPASTITVPTPYITVSVLPFEQQDSNVATGRPLDPLSEGYDREAADAKRPAYKSAADVLRAVDGAGKTSEPTWLRFCHSLDSGENIVRSFCGRCGSQLCIQIAVQEAWCRSGKLPDGWSDLFNVYAGTLDREFLQAGWALPSSEVQWDNATNFTKCISATAKDLKSIPKLKGFAAYAGYADEDEVKSYAAA